LNRKGTGDGFLCRLVKEALRMRPSHHGG